MTTGQTEPQMHPRISHRETLFAAIGVGSDGFKFLDMIACFGHQFSPSFSLRYPSKITLLSSADKFGAQTLEKEQR
jgi:hypothetical protein